MPCSCQAGTLFWTQFFMEIAKVPEIGIHNISYCFRQELHENYISGFSFLSNSTVKWLAKQDLHRFFVKKSCQIVAK